MPNEHGGQGIYVIDTEAFDGDTVSMNSCFVQESLDEVKKLLGKASTYLNSGGGFKTSAGIDTVNLALHNMTSR